MGSIAGACLEHVPLLLFSFAKFVPLRFLLVLSGTLMSLAGRFSPLLDITVEWSGVSVVGTFIQSSKRCKATPNQSSVVLSELVKETTSILIFFLSLKCTSSS